MENNLLKIIDTLVKDSRFNECIVSLAINYVREINEFDEKKLIDCVDELKEIIDYKNVEGYNLTLYKRGGDTDEYIGDYYSNTYTFWSGQTEDENEVDTTKYAAFNITLLKNTRGFENITSNGIMDKLRKIVDDKEKFGTYYKIGEENKLLAGIAMLEHTLNKQAEEKEFIYNALELFI